jgi:methionyl-tRNA formyltransferase
VVVLSHSAGGFAAVHKVCEAAGHRPVAYAYARSLRPNRPAAPWATTALGDIVGRLPPGTDLLLPGGGRSLARALPGYGPDLLVCNGFPWRLPGEVLRVPRLGAINIHPSLLPQYRGPIPIHWAIRNGDRESGVTVHRMDETFDTGEVIAQRGGVPIEDDFDPDLLLERFETVGHELLAVALRRLATGAPGTPQSSTASAQPLRYAGWMEESFSYVDWDRPAREIHDQVRTFRFGVPGADGPTAEIDGRRVVLLRTALAPPSDGSGVRVECGDGPLWVVEHEEAPSDERA